MLDTFGPEAPAKLNQYATRLEDALIQSLDHQKAQAEALGQYVEYVGNVVELLKGLEVEREATRHILTDPNALTEYVEGFFGEGGPYPVATPGDQARQALLDGAITPDSRLMPSADPNAFVPPEMRAAAQRGDVFIGGQQVQPQPQQNAPFRPTMPMPVPGSGGGQVHPEEAWSTFSQTMAAKPENAWQVLDAMGPDALRAKVFAVE